MSKIADKIRSAGDSIIRAQDTLDEVKEAVTETKETVKDARAEKKAERIKQPEAKTISESSNAIESNKLSKNTLIAIIIGTVIVLLLIMGIVIGDNEEVEEESTVTTTISTTTTTTQAPIDYVPAGAAIESVNGTWGLYKDGILVSNFSGIAANKYGEWYIVNGLVDFTFSGTTKYKGEEYTIKEGKVFDEQSTTVATTTTVRTTYSSSLDDGDARQIFEEYGKREFPYGFKPKWMTGFIAQRTEEDGSIFLKVRTDITNEYGAKMEAVAEGRVSEDGDVTYFFVYP